MDVLVVELAGFHHFSCHCWMCLMIKNQKSIILPFSSFLMSSDDTPSSPTRTCHTQKKNPGEPLSNIIVERNKKEMEREREILKGLK